VLPCKRDISKKNWMGKSGNPVVGLVVVVIIVVVD